MPRATVHAQAWVSEFISPYDVYWHGVTQVLAHRQTAWQDMLIVESGSYGRALVLDGKWQSSEKDEFLYHEPLVHVPMVIHGSARRVLILGGGEGATAREALKWRSVEKVTMVDLDREVVEACRQHLACMHQGAFDDPRTELIIADAAEFLEQTPPGSWDVIISDLSDPIEEGPSFKLFTLEYFEKCRRALARDGVFVIQAGPVAPPEMAMHVRLNRTVHRCFGWATSYCSYVPTYGSPWGFVLSGNRPEPPVVNPAEVDRLLSHAVSRPLRMFDGQAMLGLLSIPRHLRQAIEQETQIYTLAHPPRFFGEGSLGSGATPRP